MSTNERKIINNLVHENRPSVRMQGQSYVVFHRGDWLAVYPDGEIKVYPSRKEAEDALKSYYKKTASGDVINIGLLTTELDGNEPKSEGYELPQKGGQSKRAEVGNLKVDQSYKLIDIWHTDPDAEWQTCDNCGRRITNVYDIEGSEDKKTYSVGSECVVNLTMLDPLEVMEKERKYRKKMRTFSAIKKIATTGAIVVINHKYDDLRIYQSEDSYKHNWASYKFRGSLELAQEDPMLWPVIQSMKIIDEADEE